MELVKTVAEIVVGFFIACLVVGLAFAFILLPILLVINAVVG